MNNQSIRDKFFDLWSNRLPLEEAEVLKQTIASDSNLQTQYSDDVLLFESLAELKEESVEVPSDFVTAVSMKIEQRGKTKRLKEKVMNLFKNIANVVLYGIIIPIGIVLSVFAGASLLNQFESLLAIFEGKLILYSVIALLSISLVSFFKKSFRMGTALATCALSAIVLRSMAVVTFYQTPDAIHPNKGSVETQFNDSRNSTLPFLGTQEQTSPKVESEKSLAAPSSAPASGLNSRASGGIINKGYDTAHDMMAAEIAPPSVQEKYGRGMSIEDMNKGFDTVDDIAPPSDQMIVPHISDKLSLPPVSRENYGNYQINPRISVKSEPVSTFSIDVDTGSYANVRRFLRMGQLPPKDAVRIEELINYFPYEYASSTDAPFGVRYEIAPSPFSKGRYLLNIGLKAKSAPQDPEKGWNLVFLVDTSGSMNEPNKLPLVKQSLKLLAGQMRKVDRIAIVSYAGNAGIVLSSTSGEEKNKILSAIDTLDSGGSTNGEAGINLAYAQAEANNIPGSVNRVILATDGDFNVGVSNFDGLINIIEQKRKLGITLTTLGYGTGNYQEKSMEQLADKGNGNYFYIDSFQEAKKVLSTEIAQAMEVVGKDVKLQIEFNPSQVKEYRLIGFDNRMLRKEDFTNDKIDAGEVGSGHTVTALYEIELTSHPVNDSSAGSLRYQTPEPTLAPTQLEGELGFLKIRLKTPEGEESKEYSYPVSSTLVKNSIAETSDDFRFAASVAGFGLLLRDDSYQGNITWDEVRKIAESARGADQFGYRSEFLTLIDSAKVLSGK